MLLYGYFKKFFLNMCVMPEYFNVSLYVHVNKNILLFFFHLKVFLTVFMKLSPDL